MGTFSFELVSPERLLVSREVGVVVVPGTEGDMGLMPGHAPTISSLRPGLVNIYENGTITDRFFVAGGFVEVMPERCTVMAEETVPLAELDRASLEAEQKKLEAELAVLAPEARSVVAAKLALVAMKLAVVTDKNYH